MSRNRFQEIKKYFHSDDNQNLVPGDNMSKVTPHEKINKNLIRFGIYHKVLSIDKSMVPFYGRHSAKMFIKGKPIRFGYKILALCGNDGYSYNLKKFQGKEAHSENSPSGTRVIKSMVAIITANSIVEKHKLFFDNFFISFPRETFPS